MSELSKRVERLEQVVGQQQGDEFIELLVERVSRLPLEEREAIIELMEADLAGEDVGATHSEALERLNAIIAEVLNEQNIRDTAG